MSRLITVAPHVRGVVSNLRAADPRLAALPATADWRIDYAHRIYSTSEDFGDDLKVFDWLPDDVEERQWGYVQMQIGDIQRDLRNCENYGMDLRKRLGAANRRLAELGEDQF